MVKKENKTLPTVDIKGKPYVLTQHRLLEFHRLYPNGSIQTDIVTDSNDSVVMVTKVYPDVKEPNRVFTGIASETRGSTFINKTSHYENCETSSRARALSNLGIGVEESCASAEEVANAMIQQSEQKTMENLKPSLFKFIKLYLDAQTWLPYAYDYNIIDKKNFQLSLSKIFDNNFNENINKFEKQLIVKEKQLKESDKFKEYTKEVENHNNIVRDALKSFEK